MQKGSNAPQRERITEWVRFYKNSQLSYRMNALLAVYENDGEAMLMAVLKELGLTQSSALIKDASEREKLPDRGRPTEAKAGAVSILETTPVPS